MIIVNDELVLLISNVVWPATVLVLSVIVLFTQRKPIGEFITRITSLKYPGGEVGRMLSEQDAEHLPQAVSALSREVRSDGVFGRRPAEPVEAGPAHNREPLGEPAALAIDDVINLVVLRTKLEHALSELAVPPPPGRFLDSAQMIKVLQHRGILGSAGGPLQEIVRIAEEAAGGAAIPQRLAMAVTNSGAALLDQLILLRRSAAARFENHVLSQLRQQLPAGWSVTFDAAFDADGKETTSAVAARVDALVTKQQKRAIVEVRARVTRSAGDELAALRDWLNALPADVPVMLIMLGEALGDHELPPQHRRHRIAVLSWDEQPDQLITTLGELLEGSR